MAGVTSTGFIPKTLEEVKAELQAAFQAQFGDSIDLDERGPFGQLIGIFAERYAEVWEAAEGIYAAFTPDGAVGVSLDNLAAITGTLREAATPSEVTGTATGTAGTVLPSGRTVSVQATGVKFVTTADATIAAGTAWAPATAYSVGARRYNGSNTYLCTTGGTSAGSGGPTGTGSSISDNTVTWRYLGAGTGNVDVACESQDTGAKVAVSGTLTVIETPVAGWSGFINILDAVPGTETETDAAFRVRRESDLRGNGLASVESIRSVVAAVDGVTSVTVFDNPTSSVDGNGLPAKSVMALVLGGLDAAIRSALFSSVAAGIETHGAVSGTVTDSQGFNHTVKFSRPTDVNIYVRIDVTVNASTFPVDGASQIKDAVVAFGSSFGTGKDAVAAALGAQAFKVSGVLDTPVVYIGTAPAPGSAATVAISLLQIARYDTSRVTVNVSTGTP